VRREKALRLDDLLLRRTTLAWLGGLDLPFVSELASVMGKELGWSPADTEKEIARTLKLFRDRHGLHVG
jgi:glycerol-3-phosphate dehydrogenase